MNSFWDENLPAPSNSQDFAYGQIEPHPENTLSMASYLLCRSFQRRHPRGLEVFFKRFFETSKYGQITVIGKGGKRRHLSMNKTVYDLLIRLYREKKSNYIFASPVTGGRISDVKRSFSTALKKCRDYGLPIS